LNIEFSAIEARVIGCLIEKEITTPDQYPLSLNALTNACNQKTNREPILELSETAVQQAVDSLMKKFADATEVETALKGLLEREDGPFIARLARAPGARESRYAHLFSGLIESVPDSEEIAEPSGAPGAPSLSQRVTQLEATVAELRAELDAIKGAGAA